MKQFLTDELKCGTQHKNIAHPFMKFSLGRSMIEMLGVLAIIGVLSIGGLYAYRQSMTRYKSNEMANFIQEIGLAYVDISFNQSSAFGGTDSYDANRKILCVSLGSDTCDKFPFYFYPVGKIGFLRFQDVPNDVCAQIIEKNYDLLVYANVRNGYKGTFLGGYLTEDGKYNTASKKDLIDFCYNKNSEPDAQDTKWLMFGFGQ